MVTYECASLYVDAAQTKKDRIARLDSIITALENAVLDSASSAGLSEYWLDDGQTKIKSAYRNPVEIANSIQAFEIIKQRLINELNGRTTRLVDLSSHMIR